MVAVDVCEERGGQFVRRGAGLHQPHHGRPTGVELEGDVAAPDERPSPGTSRSSVGNAGAREDHFGGHDVASSESAGNRRRVLAASESSNEPGGWPTAPIEPRSISTTGTGVNG
jgi:hypothetical protein